MGECADPQFVPVHHKTVDIRKLTARFKEGEPSRLRTEIVQSRILGPDPEPPFPVRAYFLYPYTVQSVGTVRIIIFIEVGNLAGQIVDSAEECSEPQASFLILAH